MTLIHLLYHEHPFPYNDQYDVDIYRLFPLLLKYIFIITRKKKKKKINKKKKKKKKFYKKKKIKKN